MNDLSQQLDQLTQKYSNLESEWQKECQRSKEKDILILKLKGELDNTKRELDDKNQKITQYGSEVESLNIYITDSIKEKKQQQSKFTELDKKYQRAKEEYSKLKQKVVEKDLQLQEQEKEYKTHQEQIQSSTEQLIRTYESKIQQLEKEQSSPPPPKQHYDGYKKWFILSVILQAVTFGMSKFLKKS